MAGAMPAAAGCALVADGGAAGGRVDGFGVAWLPAGGGEILLQAGHHVAELAGHGEELEALDDPLAHARGVGAMDAGSDAVPVTGQADTLDGLDKLGMVAFQRH